MAKKITELTALAAADVVAADDVVAIVDASTGATKKITIANLLRGLGAGAVGTPALGPAGDANTGIYFPAADQVAAAVGGVQAWRATANGLLLPLQPAFLAYLASVTADVTGEGTYYNIAGYTEVYDVGGLFDATTGVFTAAVTGKYQFSVGVAFQQLGSASRVEILHLASNRNQYLRYGAPGAISGFAAYGGLAVEVDMDAGDEAKVQVMAQGTGGKTADVYGAAGSTHWTYFAGRLAS